jgi:hypothetical protein
MFNKQDSKVDNKIEALDERLEESLILLKETPDFAKPDKIGRIFNNVRRIFMHVHGCALLESRIKRIEKAGTFNDSDYQFPHTLIPGLCGEALKSNDPNTVLIEALSLLRFLAIAKKDYIHPTVSAEHAHHFLAQVVATNLQRLFSVADEAEREQKENLSKITRSVLKHIAEGVGYEHIIDELIDEIWRILQQRPIQVDHVKQMITQVALCRQNPEIDMGNSGRGADRLVSSLFGLTKASREDPGIGIYEERLSKMDKPALQNEATGFARAMHDTGLVSPYHAVLLRYLLESSDSLLAEALGLSSTARDCLLSYSELVRALIKESVNPETPQAIYGLAMMLERNMLYQPPIAPALWRQIALPISQLSKDRLSAIFGDTVPARARLLEGVVCILGLPLGVGQGNNPTCQSARAISMWAYNDPDYLLQMVAWAVRDDEIIMHFEGQRISSNESESGVATALPMDLDAVSLILVPHLDRIYAEMGRRCEEREGDPHRWVNPEFHGWSCGRGFRINVDVETGNLIELKTFLRHFYASYHPHYNGDQPLIHPQPAGIAATDSTSRFIGWHAITILRVNIDPENVMRVYFYNPNNDSGQNWGGDVQVSTSGRSERYGEASLPFEQFASRLYIFHFDPLEPGKPALVGSKELKRVIQRVHESWGIDRLG